MQDRPFLCEIFAQICKNGAKIYRYPFFASVKRMRKCRYIKGFRGFVSVPVVLRIW